MKAACSGRAELLSWINTLCASNYTTVAHLNDAVLYCSVVEMLTLSTARHPFLEKLPSFDCNADDYGDDADHGRPTHASRPALNARKLRDLRESNCRLLESLLRSGTGAAPAKWCLQVNFERLAGGKLQDHMMVLAHLHKWFVAHVAGGGCLRFHVNPVARRLEASAGKPVSAALQLPQSAAIHAAHARFLRTLPLSASGMSEEGGGVGEGDDNGQEELFAHEHHHHHQQHQHPQHQQQQQFNLMQEQQQLEYELHMQQQQFGVVAGGGAMSTRHSNKNSNSADNGNNGNDAGADDGMDLSALVDDATVQANHDLNEAAELLEVRQQRLEQDAQTLMRLIEQRDELQRRMRRAFAGVVEKLESCGGGDNDDDDGAHGFRSDVVRLFSETAAGRSVCSPSQVLAGALRHG